MLKIQEVFEYKVTRYDPVTGEGGLFVEYINTFLKLTAEASCYPSWIRTQEDDDAYIAHLYESEGIRLDRLHPI
jgi:hypothetical protein